VTMVHQALAELLVWTGTNKFSVSNDLVEFRMKRRHC